MKNVFMEPLFYQNMKNDKNFKIMKNLQLVGPLILMSNPDNNLKVENNTHSTYGEIGAQRY